MDNSLDRRKFIKKGASIATGLTGFSILPNPSFAKNNSFQEGIHIVGPKEGFSPQVGTLLSMMSWMRMVVLLTVDNMKKAELDYLHAQNQTLLELCFFI